MKRFLQTIFFLSVFFFVNKSDTKAQTFENAAQYIEYINKANTALTEKYLSYMSAVSHGKSARKVEKKRIDVLNTISNTRSDIMGMPPYKGDRTLKDTTAAYLKMLNSVFNEDYGKIVNMEEIAEQSYDAMEAYLLAQEKANEKLQQASEKQLAVQKVFAAKNNVNLIDGGDSPLEAKMNTVNKVMHHYNDVYLIFFKCNKQEAYLMDAMGKKSTSGIEQNINSLEKFVEEGLEKLKTLKGYNNDPSLIQAGQNALKFYKAEAAKGGDITDYYLKEENFAKLKKQFDAKPAGKRTQQDVDQFNKAVNDINAAGKAINATNADLDKQRAVALNAWNKAVQKYMDEYIPTQR